MRVWDVELADGSRKSVIANESPARVGALFGNFKTPCADYKVVDYSHLAEAYHRGNVHKGKLPLRDNGGYDK